MEKVNLKIIPDIPCEVYVDYELITIANKGTMTKIPLCRGEYAIRLVSTVNSNYYIEDIITLEYDKVWKAVFTDLIELNPELRKEGELRIKDDKIYDCLLCKEILIKDSYDFIDISLNTIVYNQQGWISVKRNDKWGYISLKGIEVIPCIYEEEPRSAGCGLITIKYNGKYGCIDKTGKEVIPCIYEWMSTYHDGLIRGKISNQFEFIDTLGNKVLTVSNDDWADDYYDGLAKYSKYAEKGFGFIDITGKEVIPCKYKNARNFCEGLAAVMNQSDDWGFIDKTGKEVIPCNYSYVTDFEGGIAYIESGGPASFRCINKAGKEFFKLPWTHKICRAICDGYIVSYDNCINVKYGYYDRNGKEIIPCIYHNILYGGELFICYTKNYDSCEFIDKHGQIVIPLCKYDATYYKQFLFCVRMTDNQKWGCINSCGKEIIPCEYDNIIEFEGGILWFNKNDQWECKTKSEETLKINVFNGVETYSSGYKSSAIVTVKNLGKHLYLDKYGNSL